MDLHPLCSAQHYLTGTACMKREAGPDKPCYTEVPTVIFYTCDMQKEHKLLHLVAVNTGVAQAQSTVWHIS